MGRVRVVVAGLGRSPKCLRIREVLQAVRVASGLKLVRNQIGGGNKRSRQSGRFIDCVSRAAAPSILERHARYARENIDAEGRVAPCEKRIGFGQFGWRYVGNRRTKFCQRPLYDCAVRGVRSDEDVKVFSRSRLCIDAYGISPDDKIPRTFSVKVR